MNAPRCDRAVQVQVDQDKCIGSGVCEMLEEATFLIDEDTNLAGTIGDALLPPERAEIIIDRCPTSAISVVIEPAS